MVGPSLDAIFFDVDDTLFSTTDFAKKARQNALLAMINIGLKIDLDTLQLKFDKLLSEYSSNYTNHFDELITRLGENVLGGMSKSLAVSAAVVAYHDTKFRDLRPFEDAVKLLSTLHRNKQVKLGVISSGVGIKQAEKIVRLGVYRFIDPSLVFITGEVGIEKDDVKFYRYVSDKVGAQPQNIMHIGDRPSTDITPANEAGFKTVLTKRGGKYSSDECLSEPTHVIQNFWDLADILNNTYNIQAT